ITDGQIFLQSDLFFSGVRPAVNVGTSVSRVGSSAQTKAMKKVAGRLRLDLAQYRELEAFAQFGSELDQATQSALNRGEKMVATLNQPQYQPWPMEEQVVALYAGVNSYLDDVPTEDVPRFQEELREHLRADGDIYKAIRPYADRMLELMAGVSQAAGAVRLPLLERRENVEKVAIVPVTGDRGLAGAFNAQVLRRSFALMREVQGQGQQAVFFPSGKKAGSTLRFRRLEVGQAWSGFSDRPAYSDAQAM